MISHQSAQFTTIVVNEMHVACVDTIYVATYKNNINNNGTATVQL